MSANPHVASRLNYLPAAARASPSQIPTPLRTWSLACPRLGQTSSPSAHHPRNHLSSPILRLAIVAILVISANPGLSAVVPVWVDSQDEPSVSVGVLEQEELGRVGRSLGANRHDEDAELESDEENPVYDSEEDFAKINVTAEKGKYLGSPCDHSCDPLLQHVVCNLETQLCDCEKQYPVQLGPDKGCAKAKRLGEQCLYRATCIYEDPHSTCTQVQHNAVCECEEGYHRVTLSKSSRGVFCGKDLVLIATDLPTLITVASGIAIFTGLICFVLKLFSRSRYPRRRQFPHANNGPAMLFTTDTGIPLTIHGRPSSRSSQRSSAGTLTCVINRKSSRSDSNARGPLVPVSRSGAARAAAILLISCQQEANETNSKQHRRNLSDVPEGSSEGLGSRRPSVASIHSSTSSAKSYSAKRLERERMDKEQRHLLQELKLARKREQEPQQDAPSPSPKTPHSTDELLPAVEEQMEILYNESKKVKSTSDLLAIKGTKSKPKTTITTNEMATPLFDNIDVPSTSSSIF